MERARHRPRRPHRRLRQFADPHRGARLVHAAPLRRRAGRDPRRRLPEMAGRRPADRERRAAAAPGAASTPTSSAGEVVTKQRSSPAVGAPLLDARGKAAVRRQRAGPAPRRRGRPYPRRAQPAVRRALPRGRHASSRARSFGGCSTKPGSIPAGRSSPAAARASPPISLIFAAHLLGNDEARLYDGSWSEWGADPATPEGARARPKPRISARDVARARGGSASTSASAGLGMRLARRRWRSASRASSPAAVAPTSRAERASKQRRLASPAIVPGGGDRIVVVDGRTRARRRTARPGAAPGGCSPAARPPRHKALRPRFGAAIREASAASTPG